MKRVILVSFCAIMAILISSCDGKEYDKNPVPLMIKMYKAPHEIRKMLPFARTSTTETKSSLSGFFILGTGSLSGTGGESVTEQKDYVKFWWNFEKNAYIFSTFLLEDVVINLDENQGQPTVSFALRESLLDEDFDWCVRNENYATGERYVKTWLNEKGNCLDPKIFFKKYLYKVVITVNPKDWPTSIQLPGNKKR